MNNHEDFFQIEVPQALSNLTADTAQQWGVMSASKMLDHINAGTILMMQEREVALTVPEEKLPRYKAFLMSDAPFGHDLPKPAAYNAVEKETLTKFNELKKEFLKNLSTFNQLTKTKKDFWTFHPSFGKLNAEETRQLQFKHVRHHFTQFGLM